MNITAFRPKSQYYRTTIFRTIPFPVLLLGLFVSIIGIQGNNLHNARKTFDGYFYQGTDIGTIFGSNTNIKNPIVYFSPYDDFYIRTNATTEQIKPAFYKNLLSYDFLNSFYSGNKHLAYTDGSFTQIINKLPNNKFIFTKKLKVGKNEELLYYSNGVKYPANALIFDNNGNFYSENAGLEELAYMNLLINNSYRLFSDKFFFENSKSLYIYDSENKITIKIENNPANRVYINPKFRTVSFITDVSKISKSEYNTSINFSIINQ